MIPFKEGNESGCWATSVISHALGMEVNVSCSPGGGDIRSLNVHSDMGLLCYRTVSFDMQ